MAPQLYAPVYLVVFAMLCVVTGMRYASSAGYAMQEKGSGFTVPLVISIVLVFWLGFRPISGAFGDTVNYALEYRISDVSVVDIDWSGEWVWQWLMMSCKGAGLSVSVFFTIVEAGYCLSVLWAVKKFMPSNPMLGMLFVWISLMFMSFGTNGLRNGLACHLFLLALAFMFEERYVAGALLCLTAFGIHRSIILPEAAALAGMYVIKNPRQAIYFWIASIFISLVAGNAVTGFFASLGFDDRMSSYTGTDADMSQFSKTGFRWDFLLYSAMPILMCWYVCVKKAMTDNWYNVICVTYCLCNAFWVMVIRSSFSNRFAYLSWFLYPIVIAYPLVNIDAWEQQDRVAGMILLAYCGFTMFMSFIFW